MKCRSEGKKSEVAAVGGGEIVRSSEAVSSVLMSCGCAAVWFTEPQLVERERYLTTLLLCFWARCNSVFTDKVDA